MAKKVYTIEDGMVHVFNKEFPDKNEGLEPTFSKGGFLTQVEVK